MILLADSEGPDQTARMRRLIWAFAVRICPKTRFRVARQEMLQSYSSSMVPDKVNLFVWVEVLRPSQQIRVISRAVIKPMHTVPGRA